MPVKKNLIKSVFERAINRFDFFLSAEEIRSFLVSQVENIEKDQIEKGGLQQEFRKIIDHFSEMDWVGKDQFKGKLPAANQGEMKEKYQQPSWDINDGNIIIRGVVMAGGIPVIEHLLFHGTQEEQQWAVDQLERLLKHVEVRRKDALASFEPELSRGEIWLERHATSALFSKYARKVGDLRFLNASMKMNDWYFRRYKDRNLDQEKAQYFLSLTEQERSAAELI